MIQLQKYDRVTTDRLWEQRKNNEKFYRKKKTESDTQRQPPYVGRRVHLQEVGSQILTRTHDRYHA